MSLTRTETSRAAAFLDRGRRGWGSSVLDVYRGSAGNPGRISMDRIAMLGNQRPRKRCIATFTADLARTLSVANHLSAVHVLAMSGRDGYAYSNRVCYEIRDSDRYGYDLLSLLDEYGIFGGEAADGLCTAVARPWLANVSSAPGALSAARIPASGISSHGFLSKPTTTPQSRSFSSTLEALAVVSGE